MKVACWQDERHGPAVVILIRSGKANDGPPPTASIPKAPPGAVRQYMAKGSDPTWSQWAQHLTERLPHAGRWSVEDVPEATTVQQALSLLRRKATAYGMEQHQGDLTQAKSPGTV